MVKAGSDGKTTTNSSERDTSGPAINWEAEGRKAFVEGIVRPGLPKNYPTQDTHSEVDERDYIRGFSAQQAEWLAGNGFAGLESYAKELDESREKC